MIENNTHATGTVTYSYYDCINRYLSKVNIIKRYCQIKKVTLITYK